MEERSWSEAGDGQIMRGDREVKKSSITPGSIRNFSGTSTTAEADADCSSTSTHDDDDRPALHDRPEGKDVSDDVVTTTTTTPPDPDGIKFCKEGCSSPTLIDDIKESNNSEEFQPLYRPPSIITKAPSSESEDRCLSEDTFSFLIICSHIRSRAFFLAILVFSFQITIYALLAYDIIGNPFNPMNPLPVNVTMPVRIAEVLAIVVAIITQDDVRKALNLYREGFNPNLKQAFPGASVAKWAASISLRSFEGLFGMSLTFLLIMQSDTVVELLLNFLAIEFVSQLDDVVFVLTREGFLGRTLQKEAKKVSNTFYDVSHLSTEESTRDAAFTKYFTVAYCVVFFLLFFSCWGWIVYCQNSGVYLCHAIFAQFGDEVVPMLGASTGVFYQRFRNVDAVFAIADITFGERTSYYRDGKDGGALLAYCQQQERWTLSLPEVSLTKNNDIYKYDPCNWIAASSVTKDFDVLTTANSEWVVRASKKRTVPLSYNFLACQDCKNSSEICGEFGRCSGSRWNATCACDPGHYGLRCEYQPCQHLEVDKLDESFHFASTYYWLEGAEVYNRPVYTSASLGDNQTLSNGTEIILFTGVRWILSSVYLFPGLKHIKNVSGLAQYFSNFDGYITDYSAVYVSEPVYMTRLDDEANPSDLQWLHSFDASSDTALDLRLQPDLEHGSIETEFSCYKEDRLLLPSEDKQPDKSTNVALIVSVLAAAVLLMLMGAFYAYRYRKNVVNKHDMQRYRGEGVTIRRK